MPKTTATSPASGRAGRYGVDEKQEKPRDRHNFSEGREKRNRIAQKYITKSTQSHNVHLDCPGCPRLVTGEAGRMKKRMKPKTWSRVAVLPTILRMLPPGL